MAPGSSVKNGNNRDYARSNIKKNTKKRKKRFALPKALSFSPTIAFRFMTSAENQITGKNGLIFYCELIIVGKNNVFLRLLFQQKWRETFRAMMGRGMKQKSSPQTLRFGSSKRPDHKRVWRTGNIKNRKVMLQWVRQF